MSGITIPVWVIIAVFVVGSVGGALQKAFPVGSTPYRIGVVLGSLLSDFISLRKVLAKAPAVSAASRDAITIPPATPKNDKP